MIIFYNPVKVFKDEPKSHTEGPETPIVHRFGTL